MSEAIDFLRWWSPKGPWVLVAIVPDGKISTTTFKPDNASALEEWLKTRNGRENIYFHVNHTGDRHLTKKAKKPDLTEARCLHVDVDPASDLFEEERTRILKKLRAYVPPPTCIIDSGGGYQAFWKLTEPVPLASIEDAEDFERYNRQLEIDLGGDSCHNVDRVMRVPGTMNMPNKKKRKKGREPRPARVVSKSDSYYELSAFTPAPAVGTPEKGDSGRPAVALSGNLPTLSDVDELDEHGTLSQRMKMVVVQGDDPDKPYSSRSEALFAVICEMVRGGFEDDVMASVILDPDFGISGHCLDQKNPEGSAVRQIQRAKEVAISPELVEMNDKFFVTMLGGKLKVCTFKKDPALGRDEIEAQTPTDFKGFFSNKRVQVGEDKDGKPTFMPLGKWWFEHPTRRTYDGVTFFPGAAAPENVFNLWRGFAFDAREGTGHERYLEHVRENICSGVEEWSEYVLNWMARVVQTPATQSETAIVLRGGQGTGKNTFVETLGALFPHHFMQVGDARHLVGNFNAHLRDLLLLYGNEAFFAGDKKHEAVLKMLVTESSMPIEGKGIDVTQATNYIHLVMGSNSDWVVPAGLDERRFLVLDVSDKRKQDSTYFGRLKEDLRRGGMSSLLHFLMTRDLSGFQIRRVPMTDALRDQKIMSMPKEQQWWLGKLHDGYIRLGEQQWPQTIPTEDIWRAYTLDMDSQSEGRRLTRIGFGAFLKKVVPGLARRQQYTGGVREYAYALPELAHCRAHFDKQFGGPYEWDDPETIGQERMPF